MELSAAGYRCLMPLVQQPNHSFCAGCGAFVERAGLLARPDPWTRPDRTSHALLPRVGSAMAAAAVQPAALYDIELSQQLELPSDGLLRPALTQSLAFEKVREEHALCHTLR